MDYFFIHFVCLSTIKLLCIHVNRPDAIITVGQAANKKPQPFHYLLLLQSICKLVTQEHSQIIVH